MRAGDVYFKELRAERLARALAARSGAPGHKDYRVTFADGSKQIVRCTRERCYADVMGPEGLHRYSRIAPILRPGARVLEICSPPMMTGYTGAWLARAVGESGAVVSIIADEQGASFAARRYTPDGPAALKNLSIEHVPGPAQHALAGETSDAFHAIVHLGLPNEPAKRDELMRELWRVLAPGGWMLAGVHITDDPADGAMQALRRHLASMGEVMEPAGASHSPSPTGSVLDVLLRKQVSEREPKPERGEPPQAPPMV